MQERLAQDGEVQAITDALFAKARNGNLAAIEMIWDRHEGKLTQRNENDTTVRTVVVEAGSGETPE